MIGQSHFEPGKVSFGAAKWDPGAVRGILSSCKTGSSIAIRPAGTEMQVSWITKICLQQNMCYGCMIHCVILHQIANLGIKSSPLEPRILAFSP